MEENKKELPLGFWIGMVVVLFAAAMGIFALLGNMAPEGWEKNTSYWQELLSPDSGPTAYQMRVLGEKERKGTDVARWLTASGDYVAMELNGDADEQVFWLYRQDSDEYVLYMPEQDRKVEGSSITAKEEKGEDGQVTLVLRIRTPEGAEQVEPKEQLLSFRTTSVKWNGIRLAIILDGREQNIYTLTSKGEELFTTAESYIGRN